MSLYKKTETRTGRVNYFKDGHALKPEEIEALPSVIKALDVGDSIELGEAEPLPPVPAEVEPEAPLPPAEYKISAISGEPATRRRFLNGEEYWLTEEEYGKYNLGKLAQAIREKNKTVETPTE